MSPLNVAKLMSCVNGGKITWEETDLELYLHLKSSKLFRRVWATPGGPQSIDDWWVFAGNGEAHHGE